MKYQETQEQTERDRVRLDAVWNITLRLALCEPLIKNEMIAGHETGDQFWRAIEPSYDKLDDSDIALVRAACAVLDRDASAAEGYLAAALGCIANDSRANYFFGT